MTIDKAYVQAAFTQQYAYLNSGNAEKEGSRAICAGRAAGLACDAGKENLAKAIWAKEIPAVAGMPNFADFRKGYLAHRNAFGEFETGEGKAFTAVGTPFSNAAGSYAFALDNVIRGRAAGGDPHWVAHWGAKALEVAGFKEQAVQLSQAVTGVTSLGTVLVHKIDR